MYWDDDYIAELYDGDLVVLKCELTDNYEVVRFHSHFNEDYFHVYLHFNMESEHLVLRKMELIRTKAELNKLLTMSYAELIKG